MNDLLARSRHCVTVVFTIIAYLIIAQSTGVTPAYADDAGPVLIAPRDDGSSGSGSASEAPADAGVDAQTAPAPSSPVITPDADAMTLAQTFSSGIQDKNWFLAIGAGVAMLVHLSKWLLKKKWPEFETKDRWGVALAAVIAGLVGLSAAWLAGEGGAFTGASWLGALKLFAAAVFSYVVPKKIAAAQPAA